MARPADRPRGPGRGPDWSRQLPVRTVRLDDDAPGPAAGWPWDLPVVEARFDGPGLYVLDEPESALSFENCLALAGVLHALAGRGDAQVVVATHSPVLAATPGARVLALGPRGWEDSAWEDLPMVLNWRAFLADPRRYWRHILE